MANTHLYARLNDPDFIWVKADHLWVWVDALGAWRPVTKQWIWDGSGWRLGYDTTPGGAVTVSVTPSTVGTMAASQTQGFSASGRDADNIPTTLNFGDVTWEVIGAGSVDSTQAVDVTYTAPSAGHGIGTDELRCTLNSNGASTSVSIPYSTGDPE